MTGFTHETRAQRVRFGAGGAAAALAAEVAALGAGRVTVVAGRAEPAGRLTAGLPVAVRHREVVMHVPVEVAERARAAAAAAPAGNPAPVTTATIGPLLRAAWEGAEPR